VADESIDAVRKPPLLSGWMIVAIVAIVAAAAVGITALVTRSSANSVRTKTKVPVVQKTTAPTTMIAATTTTVAVTTTTSAGLTNFVGTWTTHDGELVIAAPMKISAWAQPSR